MHSVYNKLAPKREEHYSSSITDFPGLKFHEVTGKDDSSLFNALSICLKKTSESLREQIASSLEGSVEKHNILFEEHGCLYSEYIAQIRTPYHVGSHLDLELLNALFSIPIVIIRTTANPIFIDKKIGGGEEPIFIYEHGAHYDAFIVESWCSSRQLLFAIYEKIRSGGTVNFSSKMKIGASTQTLYAPIGNQKVSFTFKRENTDSYLPLIGPVQIKATIDTVKNAYVLNDGYSTIDGEDPERCISVTHSDTDTDTEGDKSSWESIVALMARQFNRLDKIGLTIELRIPGVHDYTTQDYHYLHLQQRSNAMANYLNSIGVGHSKIIGVFLEKSVEFYTALFAVWKTGAVFFPLSITLKKAELKQRYEDGGPQYIITNNENIRWLIPCIEEVVGFPKPKIINIDQQREMTLISDEIPVTIYAIQPTDPAYLIFTSGTTGRPKGILVPHEGLVSRFESHQRLLQLSSQDKILQFADARVDVSLIEIWLAWGSGATLVASQKPLDELLSTFLLFCKQQQITTMIITPLHLKSILKTHGDIKIFMQSLKHLISATDKAEKEVLEQWRDICPHVYNGYGPTETAIGLSISEYKGDEIALGSKEDVFKGVDLFLLRTGEDRREWLFTEGEGEICAAGAGFAVGYWQQGGINHELTSHAFAEYPLAASPHVLRKVYRTGDLGCFEEGRFWFRGRIDRQVKVIGSRIEVETVERRFEQHPGILKAWVKKRDDEDRLSAFLVSTEAYAKECNPKILRSWFGEEGAYNGADFPSKVYISTNPAWVALDKEEWDLSSFDKVATKTTIAYDPDSILGKVASIWQALLDLTELPAPEEHFYDLGGYSLKLYEMLYALEKTFEVKISPSELKLPTIEYTARVIVLKKIFFNSLIDKELSQGSPHLLLFLPPIAGNARESYIALVENDGRLPAEIKCCFMRHPLQCFVDSESTLQPDLEEAYKMMLPLPMEEQAEWILSTVMTYIKPQYIYLAGWSYGGVMAFLLATRFKQRNVAVEYVALFDAQSPLQRDALGAFQQKNRWIWIVNELYKQAHVEHGLNLNFDSFIQEPIEEFVKSTLRFLCNQIDSMGEDNRLRKFKQQLITGGNNLIAYLQYECFLTNGPENIDFFFATEPIEIGGKAYIEARLEDWATCFPGNNVFEINGKDHFNMLEAKGDAYKKLKDLFLSRLSERCGIDAKVYDNRSSRKKNYKKEIDSLDFINKCMPYYLSPLVQGEMPCIGTLHMHLDDLLYEKTKQRILIYVHRNFTRRYLSIDCESLVWENFDKQKTKLSPYVFKANEHHSIFTDPEHIFRVLIKNKDIVVIVKRFYKEKTENDKLINLFNKYETKYILLCKPSDLEKITVFSEDEIYKIEPLSPHDIEKLVEVNDKLILSKDLQSWVLSIIRRFHLLFGIMSNQICCHLMLKVIINMFNHVDNNMSYYPMLTRILDLYFDSLFDSKVLNKKSKSRLGSEGDYKKKYSDLCQKISALMVLKKVNLLQLESPGYDRWMDDILSHEKEKYLLLSNEFEFWDLEDYVFKLVDGESSRFKFKISLLKSYFAAKFFSRSLEHHFTILEPMLVYGVRITPQIFSNIFLEKMLVARMQIDNTSILEKLIFKLEPSLANEYYESCVFTVASMCFSPEKFPAICNVNLSNAQLSKRLLYNLDISGSSVKDSDWSDAHLEKFCVYDVKHLNKVSLGISINSITQYDYSSYSSHFDQFFLASSRDVFMHDFELEHKLNLGFKGIIIDILAMDIWKSLVVLFKNNRIGCFSYSDFNEEIIKTYPGSGYTKLLAVGTRANDTQACFCIYSTLSSLLPILFFSYGSMEPEKYDFGEIVTAVVGDCNAAKRIYWVLGNEGNIYRFSENKVSLLDKLEKIDYMVADFSNTDPVLLMLTSAGHIIKMDLQTENKFYILRQYGYFFWKYIGFSNSGKLLGITTGGLVASIDVTEDKLLSLKDNCFLSLESIDLYPIQEGGILGRDHMGLTQSWYENSFEIQELEYARFPVNYFSVNDKTDKIAIVSAKRFIRIFLFSPDFSLFDKLYFKEDILSCIFSDNTMDFLFILQERAIYIYDCTKFEICNVVHLDFLLPPHQVITCHYDNASIEYVLALFYNEGMQYLSSSSMDTPPVVGLLKLDGVVIPATFNSISKRNIDLEDSASPIVANTIEIDGIEERLSLPNIKGVLFREPLIWINCQNGLIRWNYLDKTISVLDAYKFFYFTSTSCGNYLALVSEQGEIWYFEKENFPQGQSIRSEMLTVSQVVMPTSDIICARDNFGRFKMWKKVLGDEWHLFYSHYYRPRYELEGASLLELNKNMRGTLTFFKNRVMKSDKSISERRSKNFIRMEETELIPDGLSSRVFGIKK